MMRLIKRMGYKHVTEFYKAIAEEVLDVNTVIEQYQELQERDANPNAFSTEQRSAGNYVAPVQDDHAQGNADVLVLMRSCSVNGWAIVCSVLVGQEKARSSILSHCTWWDMTILALSATSLPS